MLKNNQQDPSSKTLKTESFLWGFITLSLLIGTFLRLYMASEQILLDDEWHAIDFVTDKSFGYLLTHFGISANCIPINLYSLLLLKTVGWSELALRIPSLCSGILFLALFPILIRKIVSQRAAVIFSFLAAFSPVLIFYSRVSRGYSMVVLLGFLAILLLYLWTIDGQRKYALLYIVVGGLAVYFHLFALITVLTPLGLVILLKMIPKKIGFQFEKKPIGLPFGALIITTLGLILFLGLLLLPALIQSPFPMVPSEDRVTFNSLVGVIHLLSGTSNYLILIIYLCFVVAGQIFLFKKNPLLSGMFNSILLFYLLAMMIIRHAYIDNSIEILRFSIAIVPLCFVWLSVGIDEILNLLPISKTSRSLAFSRLSDSLLAAYFLLALFLTGPLLELYASTNNFTNHSAFQESYQKKTWERSYQSGVMSGFSINRRDIPIFYQWLSMQANTQGIIEYPMYIGDHFNQYYYYQHFHKKRVITGYINKLKGLNPSLGHVYGDTYIDYPLSRVSDAGKLNFKNMINMLNFTALKQSNCRFAILHKNIMAEMFRRSAEQASTVYPPVNYLAEIYRKRLGAPVFEDRHLIIFNLSGFFTG